MPPFRRPKTNKMSAKKALAGVLLILGMLPGPGRLWALGIRIADQDPSATARGNAFSATADNPSAIYYNPAGLTQLDGQNLRLGLYAIDLNSHFQNATVSLDTKEKLQAVPQVYYSAKCPSFPVTFGLGVYSPYGLGLEWPDNAPFRAQAKRGQIVYATVNPVVAWEILPGLSIGGGPTLNFSEADLRQGIFVPGDEFRFRGRDFDLGFNAGILWQPHPMHSVGVNYRSATEMDYRGHAATRLIVPFAFNGSESARADFQLPQNVVLGYSFRPGTNWNFEVNLDWTDWDRLNTVNLQKASGNVALPFNWQSSWFYEFGATYRCPRGFQVSLGYIFSENSVPEKNFSPLVPDSERHIFSVGLGQRWNKLSWDAAYQLAYGPPRDISNGTLANGRYTFLSHALTVAFGYHF